MISTAPRYSRDVFDVAKFKNIVEWASKIVEREQYDAIAGSGHSGLLLIGAVAAKTGIPAIAVRKATEGTQHSHDKDRVVHCIVQSNTLRYAFLDDAVASGATLKNVREQIARVAPHATLRGILTYACRVWKSSMSELYLTNDVARFMYNSLEALDDD